MAATLMISINSCWNVRNFRSGLIADWLERGYRVIVAAPRDRDATALERMGCDVADIPLSARGTSPLGDARLFARYVALFRRYRPDVFLGYTIKPNIYGSLAARAFGVPTINNITGIGIGFAGSRAMQAIIRRLYRHALRDAHTVFFQNDEDRARFVEGGLVGAGRTGLLPGSGVNLAHFAPREGVAREYDFLMIGRAIRSKGAAEFAAAAAEVRRTHPEACFALLGGEDHRGRDGIDAATLAGWSDVARLGAHDDVRPFVAAAACVVLPSYSEGTPRSLLEAAAMARPLIASDIAGCRGIVRAGANGWLVPPRDAAALAEACRRFLALSPGERAALGSASRAIAEHDYDERRVIDAYAEAIATALAR